MTFLEAVNDKWLTWRTGASKSEREYRAWREQNIVVNANDVTNFFQGYKYIIAVDYDKVNVRFDPMYGPIESDEFLSYMYPNRPLGQNCFYGDFRGDWNQWDNRFHINHMCEFSQMFVATNSEEDAIIISLKWA